MENKKEAPGIVLEIVSRYLNIPVRRSLFDGWSWVRTLGPNNVSHIGCIVQGCGAATSLHVPLWHLQPTHFWIDNVFNIRRNNWNKPSRWWLRFDRSINCLKWHFISWDARHRHMKTYKVWFQPWHTCVISRRSRIMASTATHRSLITENCLCDNASNDYKIAKQFMAELERSFIYPRFCLLW